MQVSFSPYENCYLHYNSQAQTAKRRRTSQELELEEGGGWETANNCFYFVAFPFLHIDPFGSVIQFCICDILCPLWVRLLWVLSSNVFIHKNCIFICMYTRTQANTQIPTHAHTHTHKVTEANRETAHKWMDNITNIALTFAFLFGFWFGYGLPVILSSFSVLWPWERGREREEGKRERKREREQRQLAWRLF